MTKEQFKPIIEMVEDIVSKEKNHLQSLTSKKIKIFKLRRRYGCFSFMVYSNDYYFLTKEFHKDSTQRLKHFEFRLNEYKEYAKTLPD